MYLRLAAARRALPTYSGKYPGNPAAAVFLADSLKGLFAILISRELGLEGGLLLIPAVAAVLGHWNSPFTQVQGRRRRFDADRNRNRPHSVRYCTALRGRRRDLCGRPHEICPSIAMGGVTRLHHIDGHCVRAVPVCQQRFDSDVNPVVVIGAICLGLAILVHSAVYHLTSRSWREDSGLPSSTENLEGTRRELRLP